MNNSAPSSLDLLLIDPPWVVSEESNLWASVKSCFPSLGLSSIASYAEAQGHRVAVLDCTAERIALRGAEAVLRQRFSACAPRAIGITATCALFPNALVMAVIAKQVFPDALIVMGGVHPSVDPQAALQSGSVDVVVRGEGEITMGELLACRPWRDILGISYRSHDGALVHNPDRPLIGDLDSLPIPAYHLLPMDQYYPAVGAARQRPAMAITASRGCVGHCTFCQPTFGGKLRVKSARRILEEVSLLHHTYGIREICFYDDTFTAHRKNVVAFCEGLIADGLKVSWSCFTRVDHLDRPLMELMKQAGCHLIMFGVESADEQILENIRKRISLEQVRRVVKEARAVGIATRAAFMLGNQGETQASMEKTIRFACELDPDQVQFNIATAYPGTELYRWAKEHGYLVENASLGASVSDITLNLPTVDPQTIQKYYRQAHARFYLRPRVLARRLAAIRSLGQLAQEISGGLAVIRLAVGRVLQRGQRPAGGCA